MNLAQLFKPSENSPAFIMESGEHSVIERIAGRRLLPIVVALMGVQFTLMVSYPGSMYFDTFKQFREARAHYYTDWHPPIMAFVWHYLDLLYSGPGLMLIMQVVCWWSGLLLSAVACIRNRIAAALVIAVVGLWPSNAGVGTILKDMQMCATYVAALGLFIWYFKMGRPWFIITAYALLAYGTAVRHNAIIAAVPLLCWTATVQFRWMRSNAQSFRRALVTALIGPLLVCSLPGLSARLLVAQQDRTYLGQVLFVYDLSALSVKTNQVLIPQFMLTRPITIQDLRERYYPISHIALMFRGERIIKMSKHKELVDELQKIWWREVRKHFREYLDHRLVIFALHLGIYEEMPLLLPELVIGPNEFGYKPTDWPIARAYWNVITFLEKNYTHFFRPWVYVLFVLAFSAAATVAMLKMRVFAGAAGLMFCICCSGLLYLLTYLPLSVSCDYRYSLWTIFCAFLCVILTPAVAREMLPGELSFTRSPKFSCDIKEASDHD